MKIVKAEILFSRKCNLRCTYCKMADDRENSLSVDEWKCGIDNLKELGCQFICFYGAEPLLEFDKLVPVISYTESIGIPTSIITSGEVEDIEGKLKILAENGLKSLTMSYDILPPDSSCTVKQINTLNLINKFKTICPDYRDLGVVVTVTKLNYSHIPQTIRQFSMDGIRVFLDFYHYERFSRGSKVKGYNDRLILTKDDKVKFINVLDEIMFLKDEGYLCHLDRHTIRVMKDLDFNLKWNCLTDNFPSLLTIDCDGVVYPCDDFVCRNTLPKDFHVTNIAQEFNAFTSDWKFLIKTADCKCLWVTHIQSDLIKEGVLSEKEFIHDDR